MCHIKGMLSMGMCPWNVVTETYPRNAREYFRVQGRMVLDKQLLAVLLRDGML